jgi:hypothetical protein
MKAFIRSLSIAALILGQGQAAYAGMPSVTFTDIAAMRLQAISFFLLCFLLCAWFVQRLWNAVRVDFPRLPYLSYKRASGLVALWGLLFLLVLSMISGARELMTPGAWHKQVLTYKLADELPAAKSLAASEEIERRQALDRLRAALWTYAHEHGGKLPADNAKSAIPTEFWSVPGGAGMKYVYEPGRIAGDGARVVAFEPGIFGKERLVLLSSGEIVKLSQEILGEHSAKRRP